MKENIVLSYFNIESEAFQALSELKKINLFDEKILLSQVALIKKVDGQIIVKDAFDTGKVTSDDTWKCSLIGGLVGILGGPIGMLLGFSTGTIIGAIKDTKDTETENNLILSITKRMKDGDVALIAVIQEETEESYDRVMSAFDCLTIRYDASFVQEEVDYAQKVQKELEKQAREKMKEKRSVERMNKKKYYENKIKFDFSRLKEKMTPNKKEEKEEVTNY